MITFTATLRNMSRDFKTRRPVLSFEIKEEPGDIEELLDRELRIDIKENKKGRSLSANAYFHVLCDKLRQKQGISMARCKNILIARYGQVEYIGDEQVVIKTNIPANEILEYETLHCQPCGVDIQNGKEIGYFRVYRGSHTYDTKEMTALIKGTIQECEENGIVTLTPAEIDRMLGKWRPTNG